MTLVRIQFDSCIYLLFADKNVPQKCAFNPVILNFSSKLQLFFLADDSPPHLPYYLLMLCFKKRCYPRESYDWTFFIVIIQGLFLHFFIFFCLYFLVAFSSHEHFQNSHSVTFRGHIETCSLKGIFRNWSFDCVSLFCLNQSHQLYLHLYIFEWTDFHWAFNDVCWQKDTAFGKC